MARTAGPQDIRSPFRNTLVLLACTRETHSRLLGIDMPGAYRSCSRRSMAKCLFRTRPHPISVLYLCQSVGFLCHLKPESRWDSTDR